MKDFLQGKWLKHPLHPILVHVPTALWPGALVFDVLSLLGYGRNGMVQAAFYSILFGVVAALGAIPAGIADWWDIKPDKPARRLGLYHMVINLVVTAVQILNLTLRLGNLGTATEVGVLQAALSVAASAALVVSGYMGGRMVYHYGIGIARRSKGKWRKIAEKGGARLAPK